MIGNVDDHPRNHALIGDRSGWQLSPAFDIVAAARPAPVALAMRFLPDGALATPGTLLASALLLGLDPLEAIEAMRSMANTILST